MKQAGVQKLHVYPFCFIKHNCCNHVYFLKSLRNLPISQILAKDCSSRVNLMHQVLDSIPPPLFSPVRRTRPHPQVFSPESAGSSNLLPGPVGVMPWEKGYGGAVQQSSAPRSRALSEGTLSTCTQPRSPRSHCRGDKTELARGNKRSQSKGPEHSRKQGECWYLRNLLGNDHRKGNETINRRLTEAIKQGKNPKM